MFFGQNSAVFQSEHFHFWRGARLFTKIIKRLKTEKEKQISKIMEI